MAKRKFTRDQARGALLAAGREILTEVGVAGGVGNVTLADVISRSGVPRPSAYRLFGSDGDDPQDAFQQELMVDLTDVMAVIMLTPPDDLFHRSAELLDEVRLLGATATAEELTDLLADLLFSVSAVLTDPALMMNSGMGTHMSLLAATIGDPGNPRVAEALRAWRSTMVETMSPRVRELLGCFGLRLRSDWTEGALLETLSNLTVGWLITSRVSPVSDEFAAGPGGADRDWSTLGIAMLGIFGVCTEQDPRNVASAQPARWLAPTG